MGANLFLCDIVRRIGGKCAAAASLQTNTAQPNELLFSRELVHARRAESQGLKPRNRFWSRPRTRVQGANLEEAGTGCRLAATLPRRFANLRTWRELIATGEEARSSIRTLLEVFKDYKRTAGCEAPLPKITACAATKRRQIYDRQLSCNDQRIRPASCRCVQLLPALLLCPTSNAINDKH